MSSELRRIAVERGDARLNEESGFPTLERFLRDDVAVARRADRARRRARPSPNASSTSSRRSTTAEREALTDEGARERRLAELADAEARAGAQRQTSARWDVTLADGITDLNRDTTHDLDARLRHFYEESDAAVEAIDPADSREEYEQWLYRRAAEHLVGQRRARARRRGAADRTRRGALRRGRRRHRRPRRRASLAVDIGSVATSAARAGEVRDSELRNDRVGTGIAAMRGSYGGLMMFGILGKVVGLALVNPVSLVLGGLLTARTIKDLRKQSLAQRRHTTKVDGQKYIQELALVARKDNGDRLERIRRQLRDRYQQRAREHQEAMKAALDTAKADAKRSDAERTKRVADVDAELRRIKKLRAVIADAFSRRGRRWHRERAAAGRRAGGARRRHRRRTRAAPPRTRSRRCDGGSTSRCGSPSPAR